jgi:integrase
MTSLRQYLSLFARGRESIPLRSITHDDVEDWFQSRGEVNGTRASNLGRLSALFSFAKRRGWIDANPCDRVERVRVRQPVPSVLTVDQCRRALETCSLQWPSALAWLVLGLFCGIRPAELNRLTADSVKLDRAVVIVDTAASKTHRRRIVDIPPNAVAWLQAAPGATLPLTAITARRMKRRLARSLGLQAWPQDVLRHTAASMMLARDCNAGKVAMQLGHSERILLAHYHELTSRADAMEFFALQPPCVASG